MANSIAQLLVELGINSAAFHDGIDKATYAAKKFGSDLKGMLSQAGSAMSQLGGTLGASFGPVAGILDTVIRGVSGVTSSISAMGSGAPTLMGVAGAAASIGGAAFGAAAALGALSIAGSKLSEELIQQSQKLGITTQQMAALKYAAEFVNLPISSLVRGFAHFSKAIADIDSPTSHAAAALRDMGVTAGTSTYDGLQKVADTIRNTTDPVKQMSLATELFGARLGLQLLPMLKSSTYNFQAFAEMAKEAGVQVDGPAKEATERWKFATVGLGAAWDGLKLSFANQEWITNEINDLKTAVEWATKLANSKSSMGAYESDVWKATLERGRRRAVRQGVSAGSRDGREGCCYARKREGAKGNRRESNIDAERRNERVAGAG